MNSLTQLFPKKRIFTKENTSFEKEREELECKMTQIKKSNETIYRITKGTSN